MGTITSGTGLVSGLDIENIVNSLMQIEERPRQLVQARVERLEAQKDAFLEINTSVMGIRTAADALAQPSVFDTKTASSSNTSALTAEARRQAPEGTYSFIVDRLVSSHQMMTRGFADSDQTPVGTGTLSFSPEASRITNDQQLSNLNGGDGVPRGQISITDRSGASATIDLSRAVTVDDVLNAINDASGVGVTASVDGDGIRLTDTTGQSLQDLTVAEAGSTATAAGLGLLGNSGGTNVLSGSSLSRVTETSQLSTLNDRNGIGVLGGGQADMRIGLDGQTFDVSLSGATNLGQVLDAINDHAGNTGVTASIAADGVSLQLEGAGEITVAARNDSQAAADLGILGQAQNTLGGERLVAGLNSRLLSNINGGSGITTFGSIDITNKAGTQTNVDLTQTRSISEVIQTINDAGAGITASVDSTGTGLTLTDTSGGGGDLIISDVDGTVATDLKLATDPAGQAEATLNTGSLEYQYVGEGTQLTDLNGGQGVTEGRFTITDSAGVSATVTIDEGQKNLRDVIQEINARSTAVVASINERGDGLLLTDTAGGPLAMSVEEAGSTTARELGIRGEAAEGEAFLEGSFATTIDVEAGDTLADVAGKINAAGAFVTAGVLDDGSSDNSSRLTFASGRSGVAGQMVFDDGGLGLGAGTLSRGRDAVAFYGSGNPAEALMVTSRSNTLDNVIPGVKIDLLAASNEPVNVTVGRDDEGVIEGVEKLVESFNSSVDLFGQYDSYDQEENVRGLLLGDPTLARVRQRLLNMVNARVSGVEGQFDHMSQVGIRVGEGGKLDFDADRLRDAMSVDHEGVMKLFTASEAVTPPQPDNLPPGVTIPEQPRRLEAIGFARKMAELGGTLTSSFDGTITRRTQNIDADVKLANDRITQLNRLLDSKRSRLQQQFNAMEQALSQLQSQQNSVGQLQQLAAQTGSGLG